MYHYLDITDERGVRMRQ